MSCMKASEYNNGAVRGLGCFKHIDIYNGKPEGTRDIMALIKTPNNPGGLWTWRCEVTHLQWDLLSTALSSLFSFPLPHLSIHPHVFFFVYCFSHFYLYFYPTSYKLFFLLSITHPFCIHAASSTKMTYVSYNNHAIWGDHWRWRKGSDKGVGWGGVGWGGGVRHGAGPSEKRNHRSWPMAEDLTDSWSTQWNPSMRHFVLFCIKPQRGGTT